MIIFLLKNSASSRLKKKREEEKPVSGPKKYFAKLPHRAEKSHSTSNFRLERPAHLPAVLLFLRLWGVWIQAENLYYIKRVVDNDTHPTALDIVV